MKQISKIMKKRKKIIINNNSNKMRIINLNENEIKDFINLGSKKPIYKINTNTKIRTRYIYKTIFKNIFIMHVKEIKYLVERLK